MSDNKEQQVVWIVSGAKGAHHFSDLEAALAYAERAYGVSEWAVKWSDREICFNRFKDEVKVTNRSLHGVGAHEPDDARLWAQRLMVFKEVKP